MQTKRTLQENWEKRIFDIDCLLRTFCRNILREQLFYTDKNKSISQMKEKSEPVVVQLSRTDHTTE